ncbi:MAG: DUF3040 domain-containing protein [Beutenbergiaceae bacterium]
MNVPLSEYEQRVLEEMEQQLRSDDPKLAKAISGSPRRPMQIVLGGVIVLAGIGLLFAGLFLPQIWLGLAGFVAMFAGVLVAMRRGAAPEAGASKTRRAGSSAPSAAQGRRSGLMDRLEERWDRRRRDGS